MAPKTAACLCLGIKACLCGLTVSQRTDVNLKLASIESPTGWHYSGSEQWYQQTMHRVSVSFFPCLCHMAYTSQPCLPHSQCIFNFDSLSNKDKGSIPPHLSCPPHSSPASHTLIPCLFTRTNLETFKTNRQWNWCQARAVVLWVYDGEKCIMTRLIFQACHLSWALPFGEKGTCRNSMMGTSRANWECARITISAPPPEL